MAQKKREPTVMQAPLKMERMERRARTRSDLGVLFFDGLGDFVLEFLAGFFEFPHAATKTTGELRKLFGTEKQKHREEDEEPFLSARHAECEDV